MIDIEITIQEGCIPEEIRDALVTSINDAFDQTFGSNHESISINWLQIPKGFCFRGGVPATTSNVRGVIPDGCDQKTREALQSQIGENWCSVSGVLEDEVIISMRDRSWNG